MGGRLRRLFFFFAFHPRADLRGHFAPYFIRRIFAGVRNNHGDFARLYLFRRFQNYFEQQRIDVIGAGQQNVFLWTTLSFAVDELVPILKIVVAGN